MENIYKDFTEKFLPKIQEGLVISKDYFMDLFGRYVTYLTISDTIWAVIWAIIAIISTLYFKKSLKFHQERGDDLFIAFVAPTAVGVLFITSLFSSFYFLENVIKDHYIPEVRIYEQLQINK